MAKPAADGLLLGEKDTKTIWCFCKTITQNSCVVTRPSSLLFPLRYAPLAAFPSHLQHRPSGERTSPPTQPSWACARRGVSMTVCIVRYPNTQSNGNAKARRLKEAFWKLNPARGQHPPSASSLEREDSAFSEQYCKEGWKKMKKNIIWVVYTDTLHSWYCRKCWSQQLCRRRDYFNLSKEEELLRNKTAQDISVGMKITKKHFGWK